MAATRPNHGPLGRASRSYPLLGDIYHMILRRWRNMPMEDVVGEIVILLLLGLAAAMFFFPYLFEGLV